MASRKQSTGRAQGTTASAKKRSTKKTAARSTAAPSKKSSRKSTKKVAATKVTKKSTAKKTAKKVAQRTVTAGRKKAVPARTQKKKVSTKTLVKRSQKKASTKKKVVPKTKARAKTASRATAEKARLKKQQEKERLREKKEKEREKVAAQREREREKKEKEREKKTAQREKEALRKEKEREKKAAQREKERLLKEKEKEKARKEKEREKERLLKEKERLRKEKEKELERARKEKEREKERLRKEKEKERLLKEKEQEAYRKAREAERERVRSEKETARRALEGRVAQQARRAQRIAGTARGSSSRVYRPDAIPSQSGTRREGASPGRANAGALARSMVRPSTPAPAIRPAPPAALDERWAVIQKRLAQQPERFQREYAESFDMSWIHHDSALEGVVYTYQELKTAVDPNIVIVPDSSLQPVCEEIRRHKKAIEWARELGRNDTPLGAEILKRLLLLLHPEEGDLKSVKYRKEIPQHRLYFHDYAPPDKIAVRIRQAFDWLHGPEPPKLKDPVRVAARLHYDLLRTFPFPQDSGKVARLCMNVLLMRSGLPPVIVHSTERQRYYDALRGSLPTIVQMVSDSMRNAMASIEKVLDEEESEAS